MNQRTLGNLVQHWGSKITSDLFLKVLDMKKAHSALLCSMNNHLSLAFMHSLNHVPFFFFFLFAIICNRFHKCVNISGFFLPFSYYFIARFSVQVRKTGSPGVSWARAAFTSGSLGCFHPGAPTATLTCEEKISLLLEVEHTRKKCCFSSKRGRVQVLIRRLLFCHAKLRFLDCTNPHVSKEPAHVAFQLLGKLKRNAAPHFCNTFSGGERARLSAL